MPLSDPADRPRPSLPGTVFLEEVLGPLGITQREAAERLRISYPRMNEIVNAKRRVTPETALRLARFSGTEPEYWLDLQQAVDLWDAIHGKVDEDDLAAIEPAFDRIAASRGRSSERRERYAAARVSPLGQEPADDLTSATTAAERLAIVEELSTQSWQLGRGSVAREEP